METVVFPWIYQQIGILLDTKHKEKQMRKLAVFTLIFLLSAGIVWAKDYQIQKKAGDLNVAVRMDRNPAVMGDNGIFVTVKDSAGKEVTDAEVKVEYSMPAMPGMPPMNYKTALVLKKDTYEGAVDFSMAGPWNIAVKIARAGKTVSTKFSVDVQ